MKKKTITREDERKLYEAYEVLHRLLNNENKMKKKYSEYIYIFSRKKYLENNPEQMAYEKLQIALWGNSWVQQCDGKEVTPTGNTCGICLVNEDDVFPYTIFLKDCIKIKK